MEFQVDYRQLPPRQFQIPFQKLQCSARMDPG